MPYNFQDGPIFPGCTNQAFAMPAQSVNDINSQVANNIPDNWFNEFINDFLKLDPNNTIVKDLNNRPNSPLNSELLENLKLIYARWKGLLNSFYGDEGPSDNIQAYFKLRLVDEGFAHCRRGLTERAVEVATHIRPAKNLEQLLFQFRQGIAKDIASELSEDDHNTHTFNYILAKANELGYGISALDTLEELDYLEDCISEQDIEDRFDKHFQFYQWIDPLMQHLANAMPGYQGGQTDLTQDLDKRDYGYDKSLRFVNLLGEYLDDDKWKHARQEDIQGGCELLEQVCDCIGAEVNYDINWAVVRDKLYNQLIDKGYIDISVHNNDNLDNNDLLKLTYHVIALSNIYNGYKQTANRLKTNIKVLSQEDSDFLYTNANVLQNAADFEAKASQIAESIKNIISQTNTSGAIVQSVIHEAKSHTLTHGNHPIVTLLTIMPDDKSIESYVTDGLSLDYKHNQLMHIAACGGDPSSIRYLAERHNTASQLNARNRDGDTPLHLAIKHTQADNIRAFMQYNPCITTQNNQGWAPIDYHIFDKCCSDILDPQKTELIQANKLNSHGERAIDAIYSKDADYDFIRNHFKYLEGDSRNKLNWTILHQAVNADNDLLFYSLVDEQPELARRLVNRRDNKLKTALHHAAENNDAEKLRYLLQYLKPDTNLTDENFDTALHKAVKNNHSSMVTSLLEQADIQVETKNIESKTPLDYAVDQLNPAITQRLLSKLKPQYFNITLHPALSYNLVALKDNDLKYFLSQPVDDNKATLLHYFAKWAKVSFKNDVRVDLENIDLDFLDLYGYSPADYALDNNNMEIAVELVSMGVSLHLDKHSHALLTLHDEGAQNETLLFCAIDFGLVELAKGLLERAPELVHMCSLKAEYPLHRIVYSEESVTWLHLLMDYIPDVQLSQIGGSYREKDGMTPLHYAVYYNNAILVREMVETYEVNMNVEDYYGRHILMTAIDRDGFDSMFVLINQGIEIPQTLTESFIRQTASPRYQHKMSQLIHNNLSNNEGKTPLGKAVENSDINTLNELIDHCWACVSRGNQWGNTPLHVAIQMAEDDQSQAQIIDILLRKGADYKKPNTQGTCPVELAISQAKAGYRQALDKLVNFKFAGYRTNNQYQQYINDKASSLGFELQRDDKECTHSAAISHAGPSSSQTTLFQEQAQLPSQYEQGQAGRGVKRDRNADEVDSKGLKSQAI